MKKRKVTETIQFEMMECPLCHKEFAFTQWTETEWWCPHICLENKSVFIIPKAAVE